MDDGRGDGHRLLAAVDGTGRAQPAAHLLVADAGLLEYLAFRQEALAGIEIAGGQLGVQVQLGQAEPAPGLDQCLQQGLTDPVAAMAGQHRHAADAAVRGQPTGADRLVVTVQRQHMGAERVQRIAFQLGGDALFLHEHALAHVVDGNVGVGVADLLDPDHGGRAQARPSSLSSSS